MNSVFQLVLSVFNRRHGKALKHNAECRRLIGAHGLWEPRQDSKLRPAEFKAEAYEADRGADGIEALAVYLIDHPEAGDVISGSGGVRKLRWAAKGKGKRGGARIVYLNVVIAARAYLIRCYAKSVKADLSADEKKQLRQIAAHLKGAQ